MARKRKSKVASASNDYSEDKTWYLNRLLSLEDLKNEYIIICDTKQYNLQLWLEYEQFSSKNK